MTAKVSLATMIFVQRSEVDRITSWEAVLQREGKPLDTNLQQRRDIAERTAEILELLEEFEAEFTAMVKARREAAQRRSKKR